MIGAVRDLGALWIAGVLLTNAAPTATACSPAADLMLPFDSNDFSSNHTRDGRIAPTLQVPEGDAAQESMVFAPTFPPDGALFRSSDRAPDFTWRSGGFTRFHVELSSSPDFSGPMVREAAGFRSRTRYTPGDRAWSRIRELGRCGHPVYWRVVAKIAGAQGVVSSDRVSWFAFEPPEARIEMTQIRTFIDGDTARTGSPATSVRFRVSAVSSECGITESRMDFDGDGWWDATTVHAGDTVVATYDHVYAEAGSFTARAEVLEGVSPLGSASEVVTVIRSSEADTCETDPELAIEESQGLLCPAPRPFLASRLLPVSLSF